MLAGYMAELVAETLQAVLSVQGASLVDEENPSSSAACLSRVAACSVKAQRKCTRRKEAILQQVKIMLS